MPLLMYCISIFCLTAVVAALARNPQDTTSKSAETAVVAEAMNIMCVRSADIAESDKFAIIQLELYLPPSPRASDSVKKKGTPGSKAIYSVK